jgi:hypothetical protein
MTSEDFEKRLAPLGDRQRTLYMAEFERIKGSEGSVGDSAERAPVSFIDLKEDPLSPRARATGFPYTSPSFIALLKDVRALNANGGKVPGSQAGGYSAEDVANRVNNVLSQVVNNPDANIDSLVAEIPNQSIPEAEDQTGLRQRVRQIIAERGTRTT